MGDNIQLPAEQKAAYDQLRARAHSRGLKGSTLRSQEIRSLWNEGNISGSSFDESRIQPASFEPVLSDEAYWIRMEGTGGFRPSKDHTIREILDSIPEENIIPYDISKGKIIHPGQTWIVRLKETVRLKQGQCVKASPKSSTGRTFLYARLLADYNEGFDEIHSENLTNNERERSLWVLLQPLTFSHVIAPDIEFVQLRYLRGHDARLTDTELAMVYEQGWPLFTTKRETHQPIISEGIRVHLDLHSEFSSGVIGLRARHNPEPIDMRRKHLLDPHDYFDTIRSGDGKYVLRRGDHCLFLTKEWFNLPYYLNAEIRAHSAVAFAGPKHFAGFIDNNFKRTLVLEVRSDEIDDVELCHNMPIGKVDFYWSDIADKQYGEQLKSNYHMQSGPQPSKHFKPINWVEHAARGNKRLDEY